MQPAADIRVEYDQACVQCGYQLRDLPVAGVCPECGTPVARSFRGDRLSAADPAYVGALYAGTRRLVIGLVTLLLVGVGLLLAAIIDDMTGGRIDADLFGIAGLCGAVVPLALVVRGALNLSEPDSEGLGGSKSEAGRMATRPGVICAAVSLLIAVVLEVAGLGHTVAAWVVAAVGLLGLLSAMIGMWLLYSVIVRRMADRQLRRRMRELTGLGAVTLALYIAGPLAPGRFATWVGGLFGLGLLSCLILGVGFLDAVRLGLRRDWHAAKALRTPPHPTPRKPVD